MVHSIGRDLIMCAGIWRLISEIAAHLLRSASLKSLLKPALTIIEVGQLTHSQTSLWASKAETDLLGLPDAICGSAPIMTPSPLLYRGSRIGRRISQCSVCPNCSPICGEPCLHHRGQTCLTLQEELKQCSYHKKSNTLYQRACKSY